MKSIKLTHEGSFWQVSRFGHLQTCIIYNAEHLCKPWIKINNICTLWYQTCDNKAPWNHDEPAWVTERLMIVTRSEPLHDLGAWNLYQVLKPRAPLRSYINLQAMLGRHRETKSWSPESKPKVEGQPNGIYGGWRSTKRSGNRKPTQQGGGLKCTQLWYGISKDSKLYRLTLQVKTIIA